MTAHAVYRIFTEAGEPLYVGTTSRPWWVRIAEQATKHPEIANTAGRVDLTFHGSRESAFEVEKAEIERLLPRLNTRSAWAEARAFEGGELVQLVLDAVSHLGTATSSTIADHIGDHVARSSIATTLLRLRRSGAVETIGTVHTVGRPQFVVRLAA